MPKFRDPTLVDMEEAGNVALNASLRANKRHRDPTLVDMGLEKEKKPIPFEGGSTLQIYNPVGKNFDTGIAIGPGTAQFLAGAGKRFSDVGRRVKQLPGLRSAENQREIDDSRVIDQDLMATVPAMIGYAAPDVLATLPLGVAGAVGKGALSSISLAIKSVAGGALQGALTPTTTDEGVDAELLNAALGGVGGGIGHVVGGALSNFAGKAVNAAKKDWKNPEFRRLYELANENKIPVTIGDIDPASRWVNVENVLANIPSNRRPFLQEQGKAMENVVDDLRSGFSKNVQGNEGATVISSTKDAYNHNKRVASNRFNIVNSIAENDPNITSIKPLETHAVASGIVKEYPDLFQEFNHSPTLRKLLGIERDTGQQPGLIIDPKTNSPFLYDQELTFREAQDVRKKLGSWYGNLKNQFDKGTLPPGLSGTAVADAAKIYSAFEKDLDNWGQQPGNNLLNGAWKEARDYFKDNVLPYRQPGMLDSNSRIVRDMINDRVDPATVIDKVLPGRETSIAGDVMDLTGPEGRAAIKSGLVNKMTDESVNPNFEGLDNLALLRHTNKHGHNGETVFSPGEQQQIADVRDLAKLTKRSSGINDRDSGSNERLTSLILGGAAMSGIPGAGAYYATKINSGEELTPADKLIIGTILLPGMAIVGGRGANAYTGSTLGKGLHFANPELRGALSGPLQKMFVNATTSAGEPVLDEFTHYQLGNRPNTED